MNTLYPVILPVPKEKQNLTLREKVLFLSGHARGALHLSAKFSNTRLGDLRKNDGGVPLPSNGYYWSLSHKPFFVGGVVSLRCIGLDIEEIKPCSIGLFKKVAKKAEWDLEDTDPYNLFFRFWTSKEAVIKSRGTGIKDLLKCRVVELLDENNLLIRFCGEEHHIEHFYFNGHIASITKDRYKIDWKILS